MPMTSSGTAKVTLPADDQILITREFDAPKHLVFKAWTTPRSWCERWWHASRGEVTIAEIDLRVGASGGTWARCRQGPTRRVPRRVPEIVPNERIVSTEAYEGAPDPDANATVNTLTLTEVDGRTTLSVLVRAPSKEVETDHRLRHGSRHAGRPRPPRAGRESRCADPSLLTAAEARSPGGPLPIVVLVLVVAAPPLVRLRLQVALR